MLLQEFTLLFEQNEIRNFIPTAKYDEIIKKAIANHIKYILDESGMTDWERLHAKIIRDADKIDSFRAKTTDISYKMDFEKMNRLRDKANDYLNSRLL